MHTPIPGFPGYAAARDGSIYSTASNWRGYGERRLATKLNTGGYPCVRMMVDGKRVHKPVHVLIALTFLGPKPFPEAQTRHRDGNRMNPALGNLVWGTAAENAEDRAQHGTTANGEAIVHSKLTPEIVRAIRTSSEPNPKLAERLGVSRQTVRHVRVRHTWKHLGD